ncbi:hypothetical protein B0H13DRAFT_188573 [Mycena leptocephala]|nr:hypothetical protein B0H13DRAFT_188573 [Mycena leptocephala]
MRVSGERSADLLVRFLHDLLNIRGLQLHFYAHKVMLFFLRHAFETHTFPTITGLSVPHELSPLFSAFPSVTSLTFPIIHRERCFGGRPEALPPVGYTRRPCFAQGTHCRRAQKVPRIATTLLLLSDQTGCMPSLCYGRSKIFLSCLLRIKSTGVTPKGRSYT